MATKPKQIHELSLDEQRAINLLKVTDWTQAYIAEETNLSFNRIGYLKKRHLLRYSSPQPVEGNRRSQVIAEQKSRITRKDVTPEWLRMVRLEQGWTLQMIGETIGVSRERVRQILKAEGISGRVPLKHRAIQGRQQADCNEQYFDVIDTEEKAYWLGFLSAKAKFNYSTDGFYSFYVSCAHHHNLPEHAARFVEAIGATDSVAKSTRPSHPDYLPQEVFTIYSHKLSLRLLELGIDVNHRASVDFPSFLSPELLRHFLRGFYEIKGFLHQYPGDDSHLFTLFLNGTEHFLTGVMKHAEEDLGVQHGGRGGPLYKDPRRSYFRYHTSRLSNIKKFYDFFYVDATVFNQEKKNQFIPFLGAYAQSSSASTTY